MLCFRKKRIQENDEVLCSGKQGNKASNFDVAQADNRGKSTGIDDVTRSGKRHNKRKGDIGESLAVSLIKSKGMEVLSTNFSTDVGEIDIVALDKGTLVFVEVKYRTNEIFGHPAEAVTPAKQRKLSQVASQYILKHRMFLADARFDIIEIYSDERRINHIENAFDSYLRY